MILNQELNPNKKGDLPFVFMTDKKVEAFEVFFNKDKDGKPVQSQLSVTACFEPTTPFPTPMASSTPMPSTTTKKQVLGAQQPQRAATTTTQQPTTPHLCDHIEDSPLQLADEQLVVSSNRNDRAQLRPSSQKPWQADKDDKAPTITAIFAAPSQIGTITLPKLKNVDKVTFTFKPEVIKQTV